MILFLAATVYALIFWILASRKPHLALMSIFATAPFQNDLSMGGPLRFSIAEVNLLLTLPVFLIQQRRMRLGPVAVPVAAYLGICLLSSFSNWRPQALLSLVQIVVYLVIAVMVFRSLPRNPQQYRLALNGLVVICAGIAAVALAKHSGYVLGLHKNGTGGSLACGLIVCTELWFAERDALRKQWLLAALLLIASGLFFTLSRGAWITAITGLAVILTLRRQFRLILRAGTLFAALAAICWNHLPKDSRQYATGFERENFNIRARYESMDFALDEFQKSPLLGVGVGLRKEYDATNIILLTLAETGVPGLLALLAIHLAFLRMAWRSRHIFSRADPEYSLIAIAAALIIGKMMHGAVDHYWGRGDLMIAWASVGMAIRAYESRRRMKAPTRKPHQFPGLLCPRGNTSGPVISGYSA